MSKQTNRRSISVSDIVYNQLRELSTASGIPMAQIATQGVTAIVRGDLALRPAHRSHDIGLGTMVARGVLVPLPEPALDSAQRERSYRLGPKHARRAG